MNSNKIIVNNHLTGMDYPDPDVIRVGDTYYMASTTMYFFPGGVILRSYDLLHWEVASYVFDTLDDSDAEKLENGQNIYGKGMWAPSLRFCDGTFYLTFVSHGVEDTHLFTAADINGPWIHRKIKGYYHDCSLLFDDGKVYIAHGNTDIHITELSDDLSGPKPGGLDTLILTDDRSQVMLGYEGSHFYKIKDKYVITFIHWPKDGIRTECVFVSDKVEGPYIGGECLSDEFILQGPGVAQGGLVDTPDGDWYAILFRDSGAVGRIPVLVPVDFSGTIPVFGNKGKMPADFTIDSHNENYQYNPLVPTAFGTRNNDDRIVPDLNWQWNHVPDNSSWMLKSENILSLKTTKLAVNPLWARNTYTVRTIYPKSEISVMVQTERLNNGDTAGILLLQGDYAMLGIKRKDDLLYVVVYESAFGYEGYGIGCEDKLAPKEMYLSEPITNRNTFKLTVRTDFTDMKDEAEFFVDDLRLPIQPFKMRFTLELFTGVRFGMCLMSQNEVGGEAVFILCD